MRFGLLKIKNFLSYGPWLQQVDLANTGLVGIFGVNRDSSSSSNGSGKSSLLEAIGWVIWGETLRGLKADEVVNKDEGKDCEVSLSIEDGKTDYIITRRRATSNSKKTNDLILETWNGEEKKYVDISAGIITDTQELINSVIGMDFATFSQSVMLTDKTQSFCTLTDAKQKELLEEILDIGVLSRAKKVARERLTTAQADGQRLQQSLQHAKQNRDNAVVSLENVKKKHDGWTAEQASKTDALSKTIKTKKNTAKELEGHRLNYTASVDLLPQVAEEIDILAAEISELNNNIHVVKAQTERHRTQIKIKLNEIAVTRRHVKKDCDAVSSLAGTVCGNCRQQVDANVATRQLDGWNQALATIQDQEVELEGLMQQLDDAESEDLSEIVVEVADKTRELKDKKATQAGLVTQIRQLEMKLNQAAAIQAEIESLKTRLDELAAETNPFDNMIEQYESAVVLTTADVETVEATLNKLAEKIKYLEFWDHGFGNAGIKSLMISSAVGFLSERAQRYADIMSNGAIQITFNTQTENKSGTVKEKFSVDVVNNIGGDSYKGNSSGERRRADLAVSMALADLAGTRASKPVQCLFLDEPFESLDSEGIDNVFKLLKHAEQERGTVMCITHQESLQDKFEKTLTIEKHNGFSFIKEN